MPSHLKIKNFTLIEMLIVIVIIGILAAALIPRLQSIQGRARDSKRKTDARIIFNGATIYQVDYGVYPGAGGGGGSHLGVISSAGQFVSTTGGDAWIPLLSGILVSIPKDPINTCAGSGGAVCNGAYPNRRCTCTTFYGAHTYRYGNVSTGPNNFDMTVLLENSNDPDRCEVKPNQVYGSSVTCLAWSGYAKIDTGSRKRIYNLNPNRLQ